MTRNEASRRAEASWRALTRGGRTQRSFDWIATERCAMRLHRSHRGSWWNTDSGPLDKAGVDAVGERIRPFSRPRASLLQVVIRTDSYGDALRAGRRGGPAGRTFCSCGHRDPVYDARSQGGAGRFGDVERRGSGQAACDMKAGLAMNAIRDYAARNNLAQRAGMFALYTADEGDRLFPADLRRLFFASSGARRAPRPVFNAEPAAERASSPRKAGKVSCVSSDRRRADACRQKPCTTAWQRDRGDRPPKRHAIGTGSRREARDQLHVGNGGGR